MKAEEAAEKATKAITGFLTDENGVKSSRRLNTLLLVISSILNTTGGLVTAIFISFKAISWTWPLAVTIIAAGVIPLIGGGFFAFFTTWGDITNLAKALRKTGESK